MVVFRGAFVTRVVTTGDDIAGDGTVGGDTTGDGITGDDTTGDGTAGEGAAGWLEAGAYDDTAVAPTAVGFGAVGGGFGLATAMITTMPTMAVMMPRRRTDQSGRNQSKTRPTGKKKISKSATETVRRYQGCVDRVCDAAARCGEMTKSSSAIHSLQPGGGCGQDGSGSQPGGGDQPAGA